MLIAMTLSFWGHFAAAAEETGTSTTEPIFGPFKAIKIDSTYVQGVKVDNAGKIWLMLQPEVRKKELILKNSSLEGSGYRNWYNGTQQLISPANQGKAANTWTDWVETTAPFIEYWMEGKLILHLKRIK